MTAAAILWLIFSSGGIEVAKAPPACAAMLDQGLIQVRPGCERCADWEGNPIETEQEEAA